MLCWMLDLMVGCLLVDSRHAELFWLLMFTRDFGGEIPKGGRENVTAYILHIGGS